jgi:hypothetical protein
MSRNNDTKDYDSIFVPKLKIPIEALITETIIDNKIKWRAKAGAEITRPLVPFWRKSITKDYPELKQLSQDYALEISYVQNLLKIFSHSTVLEYVKDRGIITLRFLPLDKQKTVIYNLYQKELDKLSENKERTEIKIPKEQTFFRQSKGNSII